MNPNWNRWIFASASKVFKTMADAFPIHFFLEGTVQDTDTKNNYITFQMQGPRVTEICKNFFKLDIEIVILYSATIGVDAHLPYKIAGKIVETMTDFCVYQYNDGDALLGKLQLKREPVRVNHYGKAKPDAQIVQGVVIGSYVMFLDVV